MKIFISYSWDSEEHKEWVRNLTDKLINAGLEVILDQYDLRAGQDLHQFMENAVAAAAHVLVVCTPEYVSKANERIKGAGEETSLITPDFYKRHLTGVRYFPIVREHAEPYSVPEYMKSLVFIDFADDMRFDNALEELLREIYDEPMHVKPPIGNKPAFGSVPSNKGHSIKGDFVSLAPDLSIDGIKTRVISSGADDWTYDDDIGVYINRHDIRLQIRQKRSDNSTWNSFNEDWTDKFPDSNASKDFLEIYYDNNLVCDFFQVSVDGGRVSIPLPRLDDELTISVEQYSFGKLVHSSGNNSLYNFDDYLRRAGISVAN